MDTDLQQNQPKKNKEDSTISLSSTISRKPGALFRFWSGIALMVLLIFAASVIAKTIFSETIGYLTAIVSFMIWVLFHCFQLQD